jgi:polyhydroxyalkanoate synthesis regulator phasin
MKNHRLGRFTSRFALVTFAAVLAGCATDFRGTAITPPAPAPVAPTPSAADEKHREAFEREGTTQNRLNYALTWYFSQTANASAADEDKLSALIEPLAAATNTDSASRTIASVLQQSALARKRVRDDTRYATQRAAVKPVEPNREAEVRQLRARIDDLEKQLAALKSIERSVTRR